MEIWPKFLYNIILPIILLTGCVFRYNALSAVYLLFLLIIPLLSSPSRRGSKACLYLQKAILCVSLVFLIAHIVFQIFLISHGSYGHIIEECSSAEKIASQVGFYSYQDLAVKDIIRLLAPDLIVFLFSLVAVISCRNLTTTTTTTQQLSLELTSTSSSLYQLSHFEEIIPFFGVLFLLLAGIIQPNVLSSVYFLTFIVFSICWAFHVSNAINKSSFYFIIKILLTVYAGLHIFVLYLYQLPFFQTSVKSTDLAPSFLCFNTSTTDDGCDHPWRQFLLHYSGRNNDCRRDREIVLNKSLPWPFYVYPWMIFLLYWVLAVDNRLKYRKHYIDVISGNSKLFWWAPKSWSKPVKETSPLIDEHESSPRYGSIHPEEHPAVRMEEVEEPIHVQGTFSSIMMFLMRQSYIAALIIMMAWSITYHSWLTFVLLLWACLTWITPFARWFCMVSSPYLVVYANLLLIVQYLYGMNLREDELPTKEGRFDFAELGLIKTQYPVLHLGAQTIFTWVFLVTLRQHYRERKSKRDNPEEMVLTNLARPLVEAIRRRVVYSVMVSVIGHVLQVAPDDGAANLEVVDHVGPPSDDAKIFIQWLKSTLAKYWIIICCCAFLLVALQNHVSLYQIFYMVIFLMGFVVYQFSLRTWKSILRPLWWFMVVYSIVILLTIYTYQFDNMHRYWSNGTHLSDQWLYDIGLRQQSKARLLLELLIPTIFSIVIVIQLHFFHKPLMLTISRLLKFRRSHRRKHNQVGDEFGLTNDTTYSGQASSMTATTVTGISTMTGVIEEEDEEDDDEHHKGKKTLLIKIKHIYNTITIILWRIAEIHSSKIISLVVMLVTVQQVSAVNAVFIVLLAMSMPSQRLHRFFNYIMIVWSSVGVLIFMFYQLQFVKEDMLNTNCTAEYNVTLGVPQNGSHFSSNAWWLGFHKSDNVSRDVRGYLFIVLFIVFEKVVKHHQELYRFRKKLSRPPRGILFSDVDRKMADENVLNCIKYLCNNFFQLFGMEINLMVMIVCMSIRGDAISVLHSLWVVTFLFVRRKTAARLWSFYVPYLSVMLPLQYLLILGWPPGLCKGYPWDSIKPESLVQWLYLTDVEQPQDQYLLLADYFQFLVACCQDYVFYEEHAQQQAKRSQSYSYEADDEYIPPDFMSNKTWLDFVKIVTMDQFLWLSLSVVYITAQHTTSIFNSGFMVGCFFFLWHGQGLYLRKRKTMKSWWKTLIVYNFFVIVAKCWLQLVSCVYISSIYDQTDCYLIQLLNLYCLRNDVYDVPVSDDKDCITQYDTGLMKDSICFIVLLIQYRIFSSTYFRYVIREHRRQSEIAYRGAQLVEERLRVRLNESIQRDKKKMQIIKNKVLKLKQRLGQLNPKAQEPLSHYEAIYGGDYYLFEDSETESDSEIQVEETNDLSLSTTPRQTSEKQEAQHEQPKEEQDDQGKEEEGENLDDQNVLVNEDESLDKQDQDDNGDDEEDGVSLSKLITDVDLLEKTGVRRRRRKHKVQSDQSSDISSLSSATTFDKNTVVLDDDTQSTKTCRERLHDWWLTLHTFFQDVAESAIKFLNDTSSDYLFITSQLAIERKERARAQSSISVANKSSHRSTHGEQQGNSDVIQAASSSSNTGLKDDEESDTWSVIPSDDDKESWKKTDSCSVRLAVAFYYALLANTDLLCYFLMIINHMYYACVLSMPLPFFVVLWGMLSIPRPTKRFWITVITYVELVIVVKYIFQFQFPNDHDDKGKSLNFNECSYYDVKETKSPLCPPRIIGIERNQYSSVCDLLLLLGLFFHRFALKAHGLWKEKVINDEEDTSPREVVTKITKRPSFDLNNGGESSVVVEAPAEISNIVLDTSASPFHEQPSMLTTSRSQNKASVFRNIKRFIQRMLDPQVGTGAVDVYAWMFGAQFIVFIIILSSWSAFSSSQETKSNFAKIIEENNVPKTFLYMLLTQFLLIVFDRKKILHKTLTWKIRYLYMRKFVFAKLLYLAILIFLFHIFLFVVVPEITQRRFIQNPPAIFMYLFQCIYFGLSAYQVRCGYPTRILGNFLTKNYTVTSGVLFQGIQSIPFLLELRSVLDWVCTKTTLTLSHWLKMEDIYANVFVMKCWRDSEKTWPHARGMPYWQSSKWLVGGILVTLLIVVIWFPLLLMSFINSAYIANRPVEVTFTLTVGGYQPLFKVSTQQQFIRELSSHDINTLVSKLGERSKDESKDNFNKIEQDIQEYKKTGTISRVLIISNSSAIWTISPPSRDFLINDLMSNSSISMRFKYVFEREPNTTETTIVQESVSGVTIMPLPPGDPIRNDLAKVLRSPSGDGEIEIPNLFPTFMQVPASGPVKAVNWIERGSYVKCKLILRRGIAPHLNTTQVEWWDIVQEDPKPLFTKKPGYLEIIALNDLVPPLHLSFFANKGIIGLYVGFVWLVGKFVRLFFTSISYRIMFDELPNVNRVLKLCLEIYMVRESKELKLEEDLFSKLLFLYRSPETLIKWTKYKRLKTS